MTETPPPPHEPDPLEADAPRADRGPGALDPSAPLDPVDEAASATIDGLVPDADLSAIDPDQLDDRVRELRGVTTRLAEPVRPPAAAIVDAHIAAALATGPAAAPESPRVSPAIEHRPAPAVASLTERRRRPSAGRWLAVAAAIAVVALAIPLVRSLSSSSTASHDTATATASAGAASSESAPSTTASGAQRATAQSGGFGQASTTTAPTQDTATVTSGSDLGTVDSPQALTALVEGAAPPALQSTSTALDPAVDQASTTTIAPSIRTLSCEPSIRAGHPDLGALRYTATATYQSVPVQVAVYDVADTTAASGRLIVTRADDCQVLLDQLLP